MEFAHVVLDVERKRTVRIFRRMKVDLCDVDSFEFRSRRRVG